MPDANFLAFNPTTVQRDNLATLADVLSLPERMAALGRQIKFDMGAFVRFNPTVPHPVSDELVDAEDMLACGTSACAAGWGVLAGIHKDKTESWGHYCKRAYGTGHMAPDDWFGTDSFSWLFGGAWPNSPSQAAKRIRIALAHGIPSLDIVHDNDEDIDVIYAKLEAGDIPIVYYSGAISA